MSDKSYSLYLPIFFQVNEETGNRRPVMLTVQRVPRIPKATKSGSVTDTEREESEQRAKTEETQTDTGRHFAVPCEPIFTEQMYNPL